jgi:hypothetical protein
MLVHMGRISVYVCGVSVSRVCVVCYSTHHRVMSQDGWDAMRYAGNENHGDIISVLEQVVSE